ncbi:MAG: hypothetical protein KDI71_06370 [Xanthomonadales bacterium]|nr:hypothetical protein [Xanthomonadales bacterium]
MNPLSNRLRCAAVNQPIDCLPLYQIDPSQMLAPARGRVWFVDPDCIAPGDGSREKPLAGLNHALVCAAEGDTIAVAGDGGRLNPAVLALLGLKQLQVYAGFSAGFGNRHLARLKSLPMPPTGSRKSSAPAPIATPSATRQR